MKICIVFGHYNTKDSFNASVRDTFIDEAKKIGHEIDLINLFDEEEQLPFYRSDINPPPKLVMDYRDRLEDADVMFLMSACHNLRMSGVLENWIDWVLHPTWFFSYWEGLNRILNILSLVLLVERQTFLIFYTEYYRKEKN